ncbi:hypothetical protein acdb102_30100 [Acidothermaceae bacterium B102]|nr:hypothetical protein acdb102_30100 [Acidothermaceae bacterium B102]
MPTTSADLTLHGTRTFEPPYDDESGGSSMTTGSLALALSLTAPSLPPLRLLDGGRTDDLTTAAEEAEDRGVRAVTRTPCSELPPARVFGARLVQHLSEVTAGERPLVQLAPYLSRAVYHRLERQFATTIRGTGAAGSNNRANVRSVHVCEPSDGVAELAAVVRRGSRMAAIALRLEGVDGRWQCTALQLA